MFVNIITNNGKIFLQWIGIDVVHCLYSNSVDGPDQQLSFWFVSVHTSSLYFLARNKHRIRLLGTSTVKYCVGDKVQRIGIDRVDRLAVGRPGSFNYPSLMTESTTNSCKNWTSTNVGIEKVCKCHFSNSTFTWIFDEQ